MKHILSLITVILISSCSSYINKVHRQLDNQYKNKAKQREEARYQTYNSYRRQPDSRFREDKRPIKNPKTFNRFSNAPNRPPATQRSYRPQSRKRYTASDLTDSKPNEESLWAGKGRENYLFSEDTIKRPGDIIIVEVQTSLKDMISNELKRFFPDRKKKSKAKDESKKEGEAQEDEVAAKDENSDEPTDVDGRVYDKISSQVMEDLNNNYLAINGVKEVLFRNKKRLIRVQAIAPKKQIQGNDSIQSDTLLEPKVYVLR